MHIKIKWMEYSLALSEKKSGNTNKYELSCPLVCRLVSGSGRAHNLSDLDPECSLSVKEQKRCQLRGGGIESEVYIVQSEQSHDLES